MKNLQEKIVTSLFLELRKAEAVDEIQHIINTYMHDHRIGLPRGIPGPMICLAQKEEPETPEEEDNKTLLSKVEPTTTTADSAINAVTGNKKGDNGQRKGYGQCWECGEMGHPRRECPLLFKWMGKGPQQDNTMAALKGNGKYGKGGKWGKGKYKGGNGKGFNGGKNTKGYRALGKAIGKGLNYWGEDDYAAAWGGESDYYYNQYSGEDWEYGYGDANYVGNQMMLLEGGAITINNSNTITNTITNTNTSLKAVSGSRDSPRGIERAKLVTTHNKYILLMTDEHDNDSDSEDGNETDVIETTTNQNIKHKPNKRQRQRTRLQRQHDNHDNDSWNEDSKHDTTDEPIVHDWRAYRDAMAKLSAIEIVKCGHQPCGE